MVGVERGEDILAMEGASGGALGDAGPGLFDAWEVSDGMGEGV